MMFYACSSCSSYVKERDPACPFCGTARTPQSRTTPRRALPSGMSRGQWLVLGSVVAVAGCEGNQAALALAGSTSSDATFECGTGKGIYCDRATQYCREWCPGTCPPGELAVVGCASIADAGNCTTNLVQYGLGSSCQCLDADDAGAVTQVCYGGCYGAPPARLERLAAS